jgi:hypothetical protein
MALTKIANTNTALITINVEKMFKAPLGLLKVEFTPEK